MNTYIYKAALYCEPCADNVKRRIAPQFGFRKINSRGVAVSDGTMGSRDSDHWPQGPYPDGGGEADTPQHCDSCGLFLQNPLTAEGVEYVRELVAAERGDRKGYWPAETWADFYADALAEPVTTCGTCGRSWNDSIISDRTPAPAGRCPYEYEHDIETDALSN